jgi:DNA-binding transcriptional LysR family regulator
VPLPPSCPELASLDLFLSVVRLGSMSRAATAHGVTQPSASQRIRQLERQVGVALLDRSPNGSTPTDAGALLAGWADVVVAAAAELAAGVEALGAPVDGRLRVVASLTVAEYLLPGWLGALRRAERTARVELQVANSTEVMERVGDGRADIGFIESPGRTAGLSSRQIGADELVVVVAAGHAWARRRGRAVPAATLAATALVVREQGSGTRDALNEAFAAAGLVPMEPALQLGSATAVKEAAAAGVGPAVVSRLAVGGELVTGHLVAIAVDGLDLTRRLRAVWRPGEPLAPLAAALLRRAEGSPRGGGTPRSGGPPGRA